VTLLAACFLLLYTTQQQILQHLVRCLQHFAWHVQHIRKIVQHACTDVLQQGNLRQLWILSPWGVWVVIGTCLGCGLHGALMHALHIHG